VEKDVKVFFRDPAQWSQVFLLGSLIVIYLFSVSALPVDVVRGPFMQGFKNALAFLNLGMAGFVMAGIAVRFQFTAVSAEGRAFWLIRTGPVDPQRYLVAKILPGLVPMLVVGEVLILASNAILDSPVSLSIIGGITAFLLAFSLSGLAMGLGATFPDFKADNAAKASAGLGGVLFMVLGILHIGLVILLEAPVVWFILRAGFEQRGLTVSEWVISAGLFLLVSALSLAVTVLPVRRAAKGLWERSI
jgi:ABC-2 type transport system permease protein